MSKYIHACITALETHFAEPRNRVAAPAWAEIRKKLIHGRGTLTAIERGIKSSDRTPESLALLAEFARSALAGTLDSMLVKKSA
jgi:hypothetical protein